MSPPSRRASAAIRPSDGRRPVPAEPERTAHTGGSAGAAPETSPSPFGRWYAGIALVLLALLLYGASYRYGLIGLDDRLYFGTSPFHGHGCWADWKEIWTRPYFDDYAPVTQMTIWLDRTLQHPGSWWLVRLHQLLWFGACALGVWQVLRRVTGSAGMGWTVALLYVLHPVNAESALWLAERKNLVAIALSLWSIERHLAWRQGAGGLALATSILLCPLALLAKAHAVIIPVVIAGAELLLIRDRWRGRALAIAPTALLSAVFVVLCLSRLHLYQSQEAVRVGGSLGVSVWCDGLILARYLVHTLLPQHLSLFYAVIEDPRRWPVLLLGWAVVAVVVAGSMAAVRDRRLMGFAWIAAGGSLLPAINLKPLPLAMSDHYLQWSLPWLLLILVLLAIRLLQLARPADARTSARWVVGAYALFLLLMAIARVPQFRSQTDLALAAITQQPDCALGWAMYCYEEEHASPPDDRAAGGAAIVALQCADYRRIFYQFLFSCAVEGAVESRRLHGDAAANRLLERVLPLMTPQAQRYALGSICFLEGRFDAAVAAMAPLETPPLRAAAQAITERCLALGREPWELPPTYDPETAKDPMKLHVRDEFSFGAFSLLSASLCRTGDVRAAYALGALLVNMDPDSTAALSVYIDAAQRLGQVPSAQRALQRLRALPGGTPSR